MVVVFGGISAIWALYEYINTIYGGTRIVFLVTVQSGNTLPVYMFTKRSILPYVILHQVLYSLQINPSTTVR